MKIRNAPDDDNNSKPGESLCRIYSDPIGTNYTVYLSDTVDSNAYDYTDLLRCLETANKNDHVLMHLSSFGGACHTGLKIAHAVRACSAPVTMSVDAPCYSMGAILAVVGDGLIMHPGTFLMFHAYTSEDGGKAGELRMSVEEYHKHFFAEMNQLCTPFLNADEIKALKEDKDIYIHTSDRNLKARMSRHFKLVKRVKK